MPNVDELIARYGYFAIFSLLMLGIVGPAIPDETILVISGVLARQGKLDYIAASPSVTSWGAPACCIWC